MITSEVDTSKMERALAEFAREAGKDLDEVTRQQAGILVGHVIAVTPPGEKQVMTEQGGIPLEAKKKGEARVAADIAKIFPTTGMKEEKARALVERGHKWKMGDGGRAVAVRDTAFTEAELERFHRASRNPSTGRTRKAGGVLTAVTRKSVLRAYIRKRMKDVGKLNSGWLTAAQDLKTAKRATPAWIRRHGAGPGGSRTRRTRKGDIGIRIFNYQAWFPRGMGRRVRIALNRRERGLKKATQAMIDRKARKAEARMR